jgi:tetratricopeptide (TPR) repeat protein
MIGKTLGHYRVLESLGKGGMGEVYLAEDTTLKRRVAIKTLGAALPTEPRWVARLRREAEALAAVNHPNVVTVHAVEEVEGVPFVVMEFIEGRTVAELLPPGGFPLPRFVELAMAIGAALEAAHGRGVVHRDLKPGNVMVTADGRVKVVDFGLAKVSRQDSIAGTGESATTTAGLVLGTVPYMAPEQFAGEPADARTDLYALGVVLFEMATGRRPFVGATAADLMGRILLEPAPEPHTLRPELPDRLARVIQALLAKDPAVRPPSAAAVVAELRACAQEDAEHAVSPGAAAPLAVPTLRTRGADPEVLQLVARGRHLWNKRTEDGLRTALVCFQHATDRDPLHAPAWIGIADCLNMLANYGFAAPRDCRPRVRAAAERAIALSGESADALRALALATWQFDFDWTGAERLYQRALERQPDAALTHYWYGVLLGVTRRFTEGLKEFVRAEELDPLLLVIPAARGWFTLFAGRAEEALAILRRVLALDAGLHPALWFAGQALTALGRHDEAVAALTMALELAGRTGRLLGYLGYALGRGGREAEAHDLLTELRARSREGYVPPYFRALVHMGLGEREAALDRLNEAWAVRDTMLRDLGVDPPWWELRSEPRYQALLASLGLARRAD